MRQDVHFGYRFPEAEVYTMLFSFATAMYYCINHGRWADRRAWDGIKRVIVEDDGLRLVWVDGVVEDFVPTEDDLKTRDCRVGADS